MTTIQPLLPGIFSRSEQLVQTTRDHDRDRVDDETLEEAQRRDFENVVGLQVAAGFDTVSTGLLTWQDHFRPFQLLIPTLEPEALTRFIDTNTFYRRPDIEGEVTLESTSLDSFFETYIPQTGPVDSLVTLPSPTAWVSAAKQEDGTYPDETVASAISETVYQPLLDAGVARGIETVVLTDPWLQRYPAPQDLLARLDDLIGGLSYELTILLQLPFQDSTDLLPTVAESSIDGVIVDLTETEREALDVLPARLAVGLGLVDARSSLIERVDLVESAVANAAAYLESDDIYLTPTGDLQHVPESIAREKVRVIGAVASEGGVAQ